jgi:thioredoxin-related protein
MKRIFFGTLFSIIAALAGLAAYSSDKTLSPPPADPLKWYTWEEAVELNKTAPKKIMVDVYTDWCGWCKKMDKSTFTDPAVAAYLSANFYPVKFNAEQKGEVKFGDHTFKFVDNGGGRGVHELAYSLLNGQMGYPAFVYLNEKYERIMISPGYKEPADILKELHFAAEEHYSKTTWEEFKVKSEK